MRLPSMRTASLAGEEGILVSETFQRTSGALKVNEREHGLMWHAHCIAIEIMLANVYGSYFTWGEAGPLYRALLVGYPTVGTEP